MITYLNRRTARSLTKGFKNDAWLCKTSMRETLFRQPNERKQSLVHRHSDAELSSAARNVTVERVDLGRFPALDILGSRRKNLPHLSRNFHCRCQCRARIANVGQSHAGGARDGQDFIDHL